MLYRQTNIRGLSIHFCLLVAAVFCAYLLALCTLPAHADPDTVLDRPAYLIARQSYRDAAIYLQSAPQPYTLQSLCSRATLLLYLGRPIEAAPDFQKIRALIPADEPLADYGQSLCDIMRGNLTGANVELSRCVQSPRYGRYRTQIDLARAVVAIANGDTAAAEQICAATNSPLASEIIAMDSFEQAPASASSQALMQQEPWALAEGVPRVTEMRGLRAVGAIDPTAVGAARIDACIVGTPDADALFAMLMNATAMSPAAAAAYAPLPASLDDTGRAAVADAWELLTLQPSYKAAETVLSRAAQQQGNSEQALRHFAIAAAIDPHCVTNLKPITEAYSGREPLTFPLPTSMHSFAHITSAHVRTTGRSLGIWRGNPSIKEVALTFDDGPSADGTPPLLDALEEANAPATFFVVGMRAQALPDIIKRMHAIGGEVEDHTYTHPNLDEAIPVHIYEEILRNAVIVQSLTGVWPHFLRPPGGQSNPNVLEAATACGMAGAFWTIDVLPAEDSNSPTRVTSLVMQHLKPGAVILMHDGADATTQAIPELTSEIRARGYRLVTLLQLAKDAVR